MSDSAFCVSGAAFRTCFSSRETGTDQPGHPRVDTNRFSARHHVEDPYDFLVCNTMSVQKIFTNASNDNF